MELELRDHNEIAKLGMDIPVIGQGDVAFRSTHTRYTGNIGTWCNGRQVGVFPICKVLFMVRCTNNHSREEIFSSDMSALIQPVLLLILSPLFEVYFLVGHSALGLHICYLLSSTVLQVSCWSSRIRAPAWCHGIASDSAESI